MSSSTELTVLLMVHVTKPGRKRHGISRVTGEWGRHADIVITLEQAGTDHVKVSTRKRLKVRRQLILRQHNGLLVEPTM